MKWIDRTFELGLPVEIYPELIERIRGTPARLEERVGPLSRAIRVKRHGDKWSIQEHAGHLVDVEPLFLGRLDDYDAGLPNLRPADVSGGRTYEANYNQRNIKSILAAFRAERTRLVTRLEGWQAHDFARAAVHPRLNQPMRVTDMLYFQAEHDDYHLAQITGLLRRFREA